MERDTSIDFLLQLIRNQIRLLPATPFGVVGIGIGIHGTVCRNEITFTPNYDLADLPIKDTLEDALEIPVWLENEANLSALAEKTFVENHKNLIHVSIHAGVGAGIILDHHLYTGLAESQISAETRPLSDTRRFLALFVNSTYRFLFFKTHPGETRPRCVLTHRRDYSTFIPASQVKSLFKNAHFHFNLSANFLNFP